ncbi:unnamed protein product [Closterium sp. NIES-53]
MIHAATPHFQWSFAVRYVAHQLNLWPRVSLPETSPTLRWTGKVGDASVFRVWGSRAFVRDMSANKLSARAIPCVFLAFSPDAPGWQFFHPTSRRVFPSQDVTSHESVPFYRLFPYRSAPPPPPPLFLSPGPPPVDPLPPQGPAPSDVSQLDPLPSTVPVEVDVSSGAARGAASRGAVSGAAEPGGAAGAGDSTAEDTGVGGAGVTAGAGGTGVAVAAGPGGARTRGTGAAVIGGVGGAGAGDPTKPGAAEAGGAGAGVIGAVGAGAVAGVGGASGTGAGGTVRQRPYFVPLLQQPASPLPAHSPYTKQTSSLIERREPASRPSPPVRIGHRVPRPRPPLVSGTHTMALRPSSVVVRVPLPPPPASSLPAVPNPESDRARAASPIVSCLLATVVTDPSVGSIAASALVAELVEFAAACRLEYATTLLAESAESESTARPSVGGECALGTNVLADRQEDFECLAAAVPHFASMLLAPERDPDAPDIPTPRYCTEALRVPTPLSGRQPWMPRWHPGSPQAPTVKQPPGSPPTFKARYVARGFSQRQGVDYFQTFSPTLKMTTFRGSLHKEIWLHRPPGFTRSFPAGTQCSLWRPVYDLRQVPHEWHDTLRTTLATLGFTPSTADPSLILRTDTSLPPFYVLVYVDDLVFATADTETLTLLKSELLERHTCPDLGELRS